LTRSTMMRQELCAPFLEFRNKLMRDVLARVDTVADLYRDWNTRELRISQIRTRVYKPR
jgi:hypothetical protein